MTASYSRQHVTSGESAKVTTIQTASGQSYWRGAKKKKERGAEVKEVLRHTQTRPNRWLGNNPGECLILAFWRQKCYICLVLILTLELLKCYIACYSFW